MELQDLANYGQILTTFLAVVAFFGLYKLTDLVKIIKIYRDKQLIIKNKDAKFLSVNKSNLDSIFDKDYLIIEGKFYWISNFETLLFVMEHNKNATNDDYKKEYIELKKLFKEYHKGRN